METNFSPDCIIAMDETAVWSDMVGNVTVYATGIKEYLTNQPEMKRSK